MKKKEKTTNELQFKQVITGTFKEGKYENVKTPVESKNKGVSFEKKTSKKK